jgi:cell volume regulation protein A
MEAAYGPGLISPAEHAMTIAELIETRLAGKAGYADRVRLGPIVLIVRALDEHEAITGVGISLEPVEPAIGLPIFISFSDILRRARTHLAQRRQLRSADAGEGVSAPAKTVTENEA